MKKAAIDVGTNSTRLLIAETTPSALSRPILRVTRVTALGKGVAPDGTLAANAIERTLAALRAYRSIVDGSGVDRIIAATTSAVRNAPNGPDYVRRVEEQTGFKLRIIPGEEEGRLTFAGATGGEVAGTRCLVIDIGGGSTEFSWGPAAGAPQVVSLDIGCVRIQEDVLRGNHPGSADIDHAYSTIRRTLEAADIRGRIGEGEDVSGIAVAGTPTSAAAIDQELVPYDTEKVHGYVLAKGTVAALLDRLAKLDLKALRAVPGLHPDRAPTIVAGLIVLDTVMEYLGLASVKVSERDILDGLIMEA